MIVKREVKNRPKNLNLFTIRLPVNAVVSIMHRASGVVLFMIQPLILYGIYLSLHDAEGYRRVANGLALWSAKFAMMLLAWAFFHHFFAGLRHLAMDVHWMTTLQKARFSSRLVLALTAVAVALFALVIW